MSTPLILAPMYVGIPALYYLLAELQHRREVRRILREARVARDLEAVRIRRLRADFARIVVAEWPAATHIPHQNRRTEEDQ